MPIFLSLVKTGHWGVSLGRLKGTGRFSAQGMSQKTYEVCFLPSLRVYGGELSQKNGCGVFIGTAAYFILEENL